MTASRNHENFTVLPVQSRAARALLDWSQEQLAELAGVRLQALHRFERGYSRPHRRTLAAIRRVLEAAGVRFIAADQAEGPGVRLARPVPDPDGGG